MKAEAIDQAARILLEARRAGRAIAELPTDCRPATVADGYAVQDRLIELLGEPVGGWFCACTNPEIQHLLGLDGPYWARLLAAALHESPAILPAAGFVSIALECEFAFRLGRDLPPRERPYAPGEVADAVATAHPAIEVVSGHLEDWPNQGIASVIADNGTDGALVHGEGVADWRGLDLPRITVGLEVNGEKAREGSGANVLGDPLAALTWLANARAKRGEGLKAGHIHNTGTATSIYWARPGDEARADFGPLGEAQVSFPA
jgi:2-keto-4-pentenoate hydratase